MKKVLLTVFGLFLVWYIIKFITTSPEQSTNRTENTGAKDNVATKIEYIPEDDILTNKSNEDPETNPTNDPPTPPSEVETPAVATVAIKQQVPVVNALENRASEITESAIEAPSQEKALPEADKNLAIDAELTESGIQIPSEPEVQANITVASTVTPAESTIPTPPSEIKTLAVATVATKQVPVVNALENRASEITESAIEAPSQEKALPEADKNLAIDSEVTESGIQIPSEPETQAGVTVASTQASSADATIIKDVTPIAIGSAIAAPSVVNTLSSVPMASAQTTSQDNTPSSENIISSTAQDNDDEEKETSSINVLGGIFAAVGYLGSIMTLGSKYPDRGLYGSLSLSYSDEEVKSNRDSSLQTYTQEYKLGYNGNLYSPKLLDYSLEGLMRFDKLVKTNDFSESTTKSETKDYRVSLNFIKETKFPFKIYLNRNEKPRTVVDSSSTYTYLYSSENRGITGSIKLSPFLIAYGASDRSSVSENVNYWQDLKTKTYHTSLNRKKKSYDFMLNYRHLNTTFEREYVSSISNEVVHSSTNQESDSVNMHYNLKISKNLALNTDAAYTETNSLSSEEKNTNANLNLKWRPNQKLYTSLTMSGSRLESSRDLNATEKVKYIFDTFNVAQSLTYNITPTLRISESISNYLYDNDNVNGEIQSYTLGISHSHSDTIFKKTLLNLNAQLNAQRTDSDILSKDENTKSSTSMNRYTLNTRVSITEQLPSLNSKAKLNASYYNSQQSTNASMQRYGSDLSLSSRFYGIFRNNLNIGVLNTDSVRVREDSTTGSDISTKYSTSMLSISDTLNFSLRLGINGTMNFMAGVRYSDINSNGTSTSHTQPTANVKLNYRLRRNLIFLANVRANSDLAYDYINYSAISSLKYNIGKTFFTMGYNYNKTDVGAQSDRPDYERSKFNVKLIRKF